MKKLLLLTYVTTLLLLTSLSTFTQARGGHIIDSGDLEYVSDMCRERGYYNADHRRYIKGNFSCDSRNGEVTGKRRCVNYRDSGGTQRCGGRVSSCYETVAYFNPRYERWSQWRT